MWNIKNGSLLVVNTLPKNDPTVQAAINALTTKAETCKVIHTEDMKILPCVGCNACWLKTPGVCAIRDDYEAILRALLRYDAARRQWDSARAALLTEENVLIALPLYVENVPGILLEFLEGAVADAPAQTVGTLSFLLQGGFPEASQSRCCERFLETLPGKLGWEYGGTFIHGEMFGLGLLGEKRAKAMLKPFAEAGRRFAQIGSFQGSDFADLSSPEYLSEKQIRQSQRLRPVQKCLLTMIARRLGCKTRLDDRPLLEDK